MKIIFLIFGVFIYFLSQYYLGFFYKIEIYNEVFFSYFLSIFCILYLLYTLFSQKKFFLSRGEICITLLLATSYILSSFFGYQPDMSFLGSHEHNFGLLSFLSLIAFYFIIIYQKKSQLQNITRSILILLCFSSIFSSIYSLFSHTHVIIDILGVQKNMYALSLFLGFWLNNHANTKYKILIDIILIFGILVSKSFFISFFAVLYFIFIYTKYKSSKIFFSIIFIGISIIFLLDDIEKIHSLIARRYIWKSSLIFLMEHPKYMLFGVGSENLASFFLDYKVPQLYIFENIGYTADRIHNPILSIFLHSGALGFVIFLYFIYIFYKSDRPKFDKKFFLLFIFSSSIHFFSIFHYVLIFISLGLGASKNSKIQISRTNICIFLCLYISVFVYDIYRQTPERMTQNHNFIKKIASLESYQKNCIQLLQSSPLPEYAFWCADIANYLGDTNMGNIFIQKGVCALPNIWDNKSVYNTNFFIKNTITGNRFFHHKYLKNKKEALLKNEKNFCIK